MSSIKSIFASILICSVSLCVGKNSPDQRAQKAVDLGVEIFFNAECKNWPTVEKKLNELVNGKKNYDLKNNAFNSAVIKSLKKIDIKKKAMDARLSKEATAILMCDYEIVLFVLSGDCCLECSKYFILNKVCTDVFGASSQQAMDDLYKKVERFNDDLFKRIKQFYN
jgi:hypothetical protein